ncbi:MAG: VOC family protein [Bacteroidetes bacterium]|nr:MAG: VOC family protein [Bacteroidota bacterium]
MLPRAHTTLVVADYDEAIAFFTEKLLFQLAEDTPQTSEKRWVVVTPPPQVVGANMLLAKAATPSQKQAIGQQTGGRVAFFLYTSIFSTYYAHLVQAGVHIARTPVQQPYGQVAVFSDLYGNLWDLIEPATLSESSLPPFP